MTVSAELRRVAAEQEWPRLQVWKSRHGWWGWLVTGPDGEFLDSGSAQIHAQALAVGLAALQVASVAAVSS